MAKAKEVWYCWKECYYGPRGMRKLYRIGERLLPGVVPGKYFSKDGGSPEEDDSEISQARTPGDDPRSTDQIAKDLQEEFGISLPEGTPRKILFQRYKMAAEKARVGNVKATVPEEGNIIPNMTEELSGILSKKFMDMTPDEVDSLTAEQISAKVQKDFGKAIKATSRNKDELFKKALQLEVHGGM